MLVVSAIPAMATETGIETILGDVVTDGVLDNNDALELREYIAGYGDVVKRFDESKLALADVNQDGKVSTADLNELIKLIPDYEPIVRDRGPIIILKADDLTTNHTTFKKMYDILKEKGITEVSFGMIGQRVESTEEFWQYVKDFIADGAEIWLHGWDHKNDGDTNSEFSGAYDYATMKEHVKLTLDLVEENTGYKITTLGAPGNKVSSEFATMLNKEFPQIDKIFFSKNKNFNAFKLDSAIYPENSTNGVTFDHFMSVYKPDAKYSVVQFHPNRLKAYDLWDEFEKMIDYMIEDNCVFMTPSRYAEYAKRVKQ